MKKNKHASFEEALKELKLISEDVEKNKFTLDELVDAFERGSELSEFCINKLNKSKLKIEKIINSKSKK